MVTIEAVIEAIEAIEPTMTANFDNGPDSLIWLSEVIQAIHDLE
jgi:hypothetical protein